jgi:hypothetical protein
MDRAAKFELQSFYWARSLIDSGTAAARDIHLFVPEALGAAPEWAGRAGIKVVPIPYWDERHPYCNKIGLWREDIFAGYDHVCFTDCDIFFVNPPGLPVTNSIAAAVVDLENPRCSLLADVFAAAGVSLPRPVPVRWSADPAHVTAPSNCNGGFYLVDRRIIGPLATAWAARARWLLDTPAIGARLGANVDQVSLALALAEMGIEVTPLPRTVNVPTHLGALPGASAAPTVLHYHSHFTSQATLRTTGTAAVDGQIAEANRMIGRWKQDGLDARVFREARRALFPGLLLPAGEGPGTSPQRM